MVAKLLGLAPNTSTASNNPADEKKKRNSAFSLPSPRDKLRPDDPKRK